MGNGPFLELHGSTETLVDSRMQHICLHVDDVDAFYDKALACGAKPGKYPPRDIPLQCANCLIKARVAYLIGASGESVEIIHWEGYSQSQYEEFPK
jgi:hypothetical protein